MRRCSECERDEYTISDYLRDRKEVKNINTKEQEADKLRDQAQKLWDQAGQLRSQANQLRRQANQLWIRAGQLCVQDNTL